MKPTIIFLVSFLCSQFVFADTNEKWRNKSTNEINRILANASKLDDDPRLLLSEVVKVLDKHDYEETKALMIPEKQVWRRINNSNEPQKTNELVWRLSEGRRLQTVVVDSIIVFAFVVEASNKRALVWK